MAETQAVNWDEIDVDETVTEADQAASDNISTTTPVGQFLCTVVEVQARENQMKAYTCYAANLKMRIDRVIKIEQPVLDDKGQPIKRNGEIVMKAMPVPEAKQEGMDALYGGRHIFDDVNLANPKEKEGMRNRRLFIAKKLNLITGNSTALTTRMWPGAVGRQVIVTTDWNRWEDKLTKELKQNVKVTWDGYDYPGNNGAGGAVAAPVDDDFSNI